jgi:methylthioribose-1-phosphate isomerase
MYVAQPIEWTERGVVMLDQRRLPAEEIRYTYVDYREVAKAIHEMVIRGAPAIGVAAAMGVALGVQKSKAASVAALKPEFAEICETLSKTRPTAVDLFWALERMEARFRELLASTSDLGKIRDAMVAEAQQVHLEKKATDEAIGAFGAEYMPREGQVMTQCNAGDRIAANGDTANKIGTYQMAVLAKENGVPFYIAAPISTFDLSIPDGTHIPIEERTAEEVTHIQGVRIAPDVPAAHPAFDVTPNRYISAIFTERGVAKAPYGESIRKLSLAQAVKVGV